MSSCSNAVIPTAGMPTIEYDFILASQPWRARMSAKFKAEKVLAPLARSLRAGGRLLTLQSYGQEPGLEIVQRLWPVRTRSWSGAAIFCRRWKRRWGRMRTDSPCGAAG